MPGMAVSLHGQVFSGLARVYLPFCMPPKNVVINAVQTKK